MSDNTVFGGWGGGFFCTNCLPYVSFSHVSFTWNLVVSSYTFVGQGGAVMLSHESISNFTACSFLNNTAMPLRSVTPFTLSGAGGAIFAASASLFVKSSSFSSNKALTGQFDDGSIGGAVLLENVGTAEFSLCSFDSNSAQGFFGFSSYASSGSGGAIMFKFSTALILNCFFRENWVRSFCTSSLAWFCVCFCMDYELFIHNFQFE